MRHLVYQLEKGENGGYLHWQGCVTFLTNTRRTAAQSKLGFPCQAHLEPTRSASAVTYCTKELTRVEGPFEFGVKITKGARTDLSKIPELIQSGKNETWFMMEQPGLYLKYHGGLGRMIRRLTSLKARTKRRTIRLTVLWGESGTGKTWEAWNRYPNAYEWSTGVEFNDYNGEKEVFIDEFDKLDFTRYKWEYWLRLFDIYSFSARILYGTVPILADTFILTMNQEPSTMWAGVGWARRLASAEVIEWKREMWVDDVAMFDQ